MNYKYFENKECEYYPCHDFEHQNCLFCFCPLYMFDCGQDAIINNGIKDCSQCTFPHDKENYDKIIDFLKKELFK